MTRCALLVLCPFIWTGFSHAITLHVTDDTEFRIRSKARSSHFRHGHAHGERDHGSRDRDTISVHHHRRGKHSLGLIKFDVSPLQPDVQIERAILRLWVSELHRAGQLHLQEVLENWQEKRFRSKDFPPLGPVFHSFPIGKSDKEHFLAVEVTTIVQGWLEHPTMNFGLALVSDEADPVGVEFDSKENRRTSHPPEIEVILAPGIGPEGPVGPKGDPGPQGPTGPAGQLLMLGQNCPPGEFLSGFDLEGNILCHALPTGMPPPPSEVNDANPGDVIITEIMSNPNSVNDTAGEWFEIFNTRAETVNLAGWSIRDEGGSHVIPDSTPLLLGAGAFFILGNNANFATNGGIPTDYEYNGITLNNTGDAITLSDVNDEVIDQVDYGMAFTIPSAGISLNLSTAQFNGMDNDQGASWCASTTPIPTGSDFGTPGTENVLCPTAP